MRSLTGKRHCISASGTARRRLEIGFVLLSWSLGLLTFADCRRLAEHYKIEAAQIGITPRRSTVLTNISRSYVTLARQLEILVSIAKEEDR